jgi:hypothetical protein
MDQRLTKGEFIGKNLANDEIHLNGTTIRQNSCPKIKGESKSSLYFIFMWMI